MSKINPLQTISQKINFFMNHPNLFLEKFAARSEIVTLPRFAPLRFCCSILRSPVHNQGFKPKIPSSLAGIVTWRTKKSTVPRCFSQGGVLAQVAEQDLCGKNTIILRTEPSEGVADGFEHVFGREGFGECFVGAELPGGF